MAYGLPEYDEMKHIVYVFVPLTDDDKKTTIFHNGNIGAKGYSISYFVGSVGHCNMTEMEIAHSPAFYVGDVDFCKKLSRLAKTAFSTDKAFAQYNGKSFKRNRPLYSIRHRLSCKWILDNDKLPPSDFGQLVNATIGDENIRKEILEMVQTEFDIRKHPNVEKYMTKMKWFVHAAEPMASKEAEKQALHLIAETQLKYQQR